MKALDWQTWISGSSPSFVSQITQFNYIFRLSSSKFGIPVPIISSTPGQFQIEFDQKTGQRPLLHRCLDHKWMVIIIKDCLQNIFDISPYFVSSFFIGLSNFRGTTEPKPKLNYSKKFMKSSSLCLFNIYIFNYLVKETKDQTRQQFQGEIANRPQLLKTTYILSLRPGLHSFSGRWFHRLLLDVRLVCNKAIIIHDTI